MAYIFVYAIFCNFPSYTFGAWSAQKKREVRLLFTLIQGFAIPLPSRKTTEVHARIYTPHLHAGWPCVSGDSLVAGYHDGGWIVRERGLEEVNANRNIEGRG